RIGQWTFDQVLLLFATFHVVDFLMSITFQRNLSFDLPRLIQRGELDSRMVLPTHLLFFISFENIDLNKLKKSGRLLTLISLILSRETNY
ncbi:MAG: hypothetical protein HGB14_03700, partial [Anaerolineaceae bacterium]|nr:hypothetical protein [Anaerolineaceae bacterium]